MKDGNNVHDHLNKKSTYFNSVYNLNKAEPVYDGKNDPNEYILNSLGFRSDEINFKKDFLFSGCSFTFGVGVPENGTWVSHIANNLNIEYHNLASCGKSVTWIVNNLFNYFKSYGNPKVLLCLFPNFSRMNMLSRKSHMQSKYGKIYMQDKYDKNKNNPDGVIEYSIDLHNFYKNQVKISKQIHFAEEIIPPELAIYNSIEHIKMLEIYCNSNGIKFFWSTWAEHEHNYLSNNIKDTDFENFIQLDINQWHSRIYDKFYDRYHDSEKTFYECQGKCSSYKDCHNDLRIKYGENFDLASDIGSKYGYHHWGVHKHIHIAEYFLKEINDYNIRS
jgi:hypothetical protein